MGYKITKAKFNEALQGSLGIISTIAQRMGVERATVYAYLNRHPKLKEEIEKEKEKILDKAEVELFKLINNGDWQAIKYLLDKKGKARGYVDTQNQEITHKGVDLAEVRKLLSDEHQED